MSKGSSTGIHSFDKVKHQKRRLQSLLQSFYGDFSSDNMEPTPQQIALRKKRQECQARLDAKKSERRHRGGYHKTKAGQGRGVSIE